MMMSYFQELLICAMLHIANAGAELEEQHPWLYMPRALQAPHDFSGPLLAISCHE